MKNLLVSIGVASILCAMAVPASPAQELAGDVDPAIKAEIGYAEWLLNRMNLPDYSKMVIDKIRDKAPSAEVLIKVIEMQSLVNIGKFPEVLAIIAREKDQNGQQAWAMKLTLADGYYAWGKYSDAQAIYDSFFAKYPTGPNETLNEFYMNSAYKYSQMLVLMGKDEAAVAAYRNVLKAKLQRHVRRQVLSEMAERIMKLAEEAKPEKRQPYFDELKKLTTEILWLQDVWFGKAIVILAHVRMLQGDIPGAQKLIDEYGPQLRQIDENLKQQEKETKEPLSRLSPMAECRYLMGAMMQQQAEKLLATGGDTNKVIELLAGRLIDPKTKTRTTGALQHFVNVFVGYPETSWAPDAGIRATQVEEILEKKFGAVIKRSVTPEQMARVEAAQFQEARSLFNQQQFQQAADSFVKVLNLFPEKESAIGGLGDLSRCYVDLNDELMVDLTVRYLAERFSRKKEDLMAKAGDQLLRTASLYGERNAEVRKDWVYKQYFDAFPNHPLVAANLFRFGEDKLSANDYAGALEYYQRIESGYTNSPLYKEALSRIAFCYAKTENVESEVKAIEKYIKHLESVGKPDANLVNAKFRQAAAFRRMGAKFLPNALNRFADLVTMLTATNSPYNSTPEDAEKNREIIEGSLFFKASCYAQLTEPADKVKAYREAAITTLTQLVDRYPKSKYAPAALSQIGTLWTLLGNPEESGKALKRLQKEYPDSPEAKMVLYMLAKNLLDMGYRREAILKFKEMFTAGATYSDAQVLTAAKELHAAKEYDIALKGYDRVLASSKERSLREPAFMGKGSLLVEQARYGDAVKALQQMLAEFPNSGYVPDICVQLSRAYAELGSAEPDASKRMANFNEAVKSVNRVLKIDTSAARQSATAVAVARIYMLKAQAEDKFGTKDKATQYRDDAVATLQSLMLTADAGNPTIRPHVEEAYRLCIPLLEERGRWADVAEDCDTYLELFPMGKYVNEISAARSRAKVKSSGTGAPAGGKSPATGSKEPVAGTNAPVAAPVTPAVTAAPAVPATITTPAAPAAPAGSAPASN